MTVKGAPLALCRLPCGDMGGAPALTRQSTIRSERTHVDDPDNSARIGTVQAAETVAEQHHSKNGLSEHHARPPPGGGPRPPQPSGGAARAGRTVVLAVEATQRREDVGEPDGVPHAGYFAQRGTGLCVHVGRPGRQDDPLFRRREGLVVQHFVRRRIVRGGMEEGMEILELVLHWSSLGSLTLLSEGCDDDGGHRPAVARCGVKGGQAAFFCSICGEAGLPPAIWIRRGFIASGTSRTRSMINSPSWNETCFTWTSSARLNTRRNGRAAMPWYRNSPAALSGFLPSILRRSAPR